MLYDDLLFYPIPRKMYTIQIIIVHLFFATEFSFNVLFLNMISYFLFFDNEHLMRCILNII